MSNLFSAFFFLIFSLVFFGMFFWLRWGTRSWYETKGKFVDRGRAFRSRSNFPIVEFVDKEGKVKQAETNRVAVYFREPLKLRVSPDGTVHTKGSEWWAMLPAIPLFALSVQLFLSL
ncbi:hypothetical protein HZB74_00370 [Candidatus Saccharibacteria bacterium]|nr:hypothetical protein [Candidatus Saccharibacteria bacterium]